MLKGVILSHEGEIGLRQLRVTERKYKYKTFTMDDSQNEISDDLTRVIYIDVPLTKAITGLDELEFYLMTDLQLSKLSPLAKATINAAINMALTNNEFRVWNNHQREIVRRSGIEEFLQDFWPKQI